jgi:hypothetical protein
MVLKPPNLQKEVLHNQKKGEDEMLPHFFPKPHVEQ